MTVRHITAAANVDSEGFLIDPALVCHGSLRANRIDQLAGQIDPSTHLNSDFPDHQLGECVVAAELKTGARLMLDENGQFERARPAVDARQPLGEVNVGERRIQWLAALQARRSSPATAISENQKRCMS